MRTFLQHHYRRLKGGTNSDPYQRVKDIRFAINSLIVVLLSILVFIGSIQQRLYTIILGIIVISYLPFLIIDLFHRPRWTKLFLRGGIILTLLWGVLGFVDSHMLLNVLWSGGFIAIGWMTWDYCYIVRTRKIRNIYYQVSIIGVFVVSIAFAVISMRRFQSINFSCQNISFLSTQFFNEVTTANPQQQQTVNNAVTNGGRSSYLQLLDQRLKTNDTQSLGNTIKQEIRNSVITVMDQKQLYDNSICDYVTQALKENYQKPSFFYSGVFLLTFIALPAAKLALLITAGIFSLIVRGLHYLKVYRSTSTMIEHQMLE